MNKIRGWQVLALLGLAFVLPPLFMLLAWVIAGVSMSDTACLRGLGSFAISVFVFIVAATWAEGDR